MAITNTQIKEKLQKFLKREPSENEVKNGFRDQNIVNEVILDQLEDLNTQIIDLQKQLKK